MRFDLDRLPTDPVLLQKMLRELAEVMEQERAELKAAQATIKVQALTIEKLEYRVMGLLRVRFDSSSEKMNIAQLRLMFDEVDAPQAANDDAPAAAKPRSARKPAIRDEHARLLPRGIVAMRKHALLCEGDEAALLSIQADANKGEPPCTPSPDIRSNQ